MDAIESLIRPRLNGHKMAYAEVGDNRVTTDNAYEADPVEIQNDCQMVAIECAVRNMWEDTLILDHRKRGEPGYDLPPDKYFEASSLGQVHQLLGIEPSQEAKVLAARQLYFGPAVRGECPGVSTAEVVDLDITQAAEIFRITKAHVWQRVTYYRHMLGVVPKIPVGKEYVKDLRSWDFTTPQNRPDKLLEVYAASVAAMLEETPVLLRYHDDEGNGVPRISLTGMVKPETVIEFTTEWVPEYGLFDLKFRPNDGYATGYELASR